MSQEIPTVYSHDIKISDTAKGIRIDVHVYANDKQEAIKQAFDMYNDAKARALKDKIPLAPIEVK